MRLCVGVPSGPHGQLSPCRASWAALFTFVSIGVFLLLIPDLASSQGVGRVLSEEGDNMAARRSQGGVQR